MADNYQKSKSVFNGRMGEKILSNDLTIIDDSLRQKGLGSAYFDGEGVNGKKTILVKEGRFESLLYDSYTAAKDKTKSTGNGHRSFKGVPGVTVNNFYLSFNKQADDLYRDFTGLVVTRVMGLHTANPITGDFSFGSSGYWMENGKRKYGVRNMAVAGNLKDLFNKIEVSEKEPLFIGHVGCPGLKVNDMNIAGE
jgi:PmbA protein